MVKRVTKRAPKDVKQHERVLYDLYLMLENYTTKKVPELTKGIKCLNNSSVKLNAHNKVSITNVGNNRSRIQM